MAVDGENERVVNTNSLASAANASEDVFAWAPSGGPSGAASAAASRMSGVRVMPSGRGNLMIVSSADLVVFGVYSVYDLQLMLLQ